MSEPRPVSAARMRILMIMVAAVIMLACLVIAAITPRPIPVELIQFLTQAFTLSAGCLVVAFNYEFGSSRGSKDKDDQMSLSMKDKDETIKTMATGTGAGGGGTSITSGTTTVVASGAPAVSVTETLKEEPKP